MHHLDELTGRIAVDPSGCWHWTGTITTKGYGQYRHQQAHRVIFELAAGSVPDGLVLDHLCRVRHCVNPAHLEPVTNRANVMRGDTPLANRERCHSGRHVLAASGVITDAAGHRRCRECRLESKRRYRERNAA